MLISEDLKMTSYIILSGIFLLSCCFTLTAWDKISFNLGSKNIAMEKLNWFQYNKSPNSHTDLSFHSMHSNLACSVKQNVGRLLTADRMQELLLLSSHAHLVTSLADSNK